MLAGFLAEFNATQTQKKELFGTLNECFKTSEASTYLAYTERVLSDTEENDSSPMSVMKPTSINNHVNHLGVSVGRYVSVLYRIPYKTVVVFFMFRNYLTQ